MDTKNLSTLKIHKLTRAQYDRELAAGRIDEDALYITPDEETDLSLYATTEQVESALTESKEYTDEQIDSIDNTVAELSQAVSVAIQQHNDFITVDDIENVELITINDIDTICGGSIVAASEVTY